MDKELFKRDPRDFALGLVDDGIVDPMLMLTAALNWMSTDEVRDMLDANELSPRFDYDEEEDDLAEDPDFRAGFDNYRD